MGHNGTWKPMAVWKRKAGRQNKKPFLSCLPVCRGTSCSFCLSSFLWCIQSPLSKQCFIFLVLFTSISAKVLLASMSLSVCRCFSEVCYTHRVGRKPPLELQHHLNCSSGHVLCAGRKYSLGKYVTYWVLPLLHVSAVRTTGTCCSHPDARTEDCPVPSAIRCFPCFLSLMIHLKDPGCCFCWPGFGA